ncbi:hypothetical protein DFH27DRAFT_268321 [Peziza echinospora]|nr:hypothetical protein DFH27DRAFT_268321 [Peziza echinospora]
MAAAPVTSSDSSEPRPLSLASQDRRVEGLGGSMSGRMSSAGGSFSSRSVSFMEGGQWKSVRTLPTWVQRREEDEPDSDRPISIISQPPTAHARRPPERSIHDAHRETTPFTVSSGPDNASRWRSFAYGSSLPPPTAHSEKIKKENNDNNWLDEQGDLDGPWLASTRDPENDRESNDGDLLFVSAKTRRRWYKRLHIMLLNNPMVPLTFRAIIWVLSLLALALAVSVFQFSKEYKYAQKPSTIMAIVVDAVALIYLVWITYDEYSGKPLGLRSPKAKMKLIMFDLLFIIFDSANLSLAFDTLFDTRWSCRSPSSAQDFWASENASIMRTVEPICRRQQALAAFLFLALCGWVLTFTISVFRLVERVSKA